MTQPQPPNSLSETINEILATARTDLTANASVKFSAHKEAAILAEARERLTELVERDHLTTPGEVRAAWHHLVIEFHRENHWGFDDAEDDAFIAGPLVAAPKAQAQTKAGGKFLRQLFVTLVIMKGLLLYFGSYYSSFPGQGYGWGLVATLIFSLGSLTYLVWRYSQMDL